jgi:signal recognition particle receptor subunit alpha
MLDGFEVVTSSGVVLWSRKYSNISANLVNSLIREVFIEERKHTTATAVSQAAKNPPFRKEQHTLKWTVVKDLGLMFVVGT